MTLYSSVTNHKREKGPILNSYYSFLKKFIFDKSTKTFAAYKRTKFTKSLESETGVNVTWHGNGCVDHNLNYLYTKYEMPSYFTCHEIHFIKFYKVFDLKKTQVHKVTEE